ncbi:hypothetical protein [Campylobacter fetus]|uniref:hypothetical protein n=1 Tax=Campylobacter fetus TaxID=196 RepID=UPI000FCC97C5|nr:hypothetical protein [Campylobacter fetus]RUT50349.1 hypothetical protein BWK67_03960 [Campylobacter fetus]RUT50667.1 hypothetical protein BWK51_03945 [Campylobacter fetus]
MKYYIYPNGKVGQDIKRILEKTGFDKEFIEVNDEFVKNNHKEMQDGIVLISSQKYYFDIAKKCTKFDLKYTNGIKFAADILNKFILTISPINKNIGVILAGPAGNKHRGSVLNDLIKGGGGYKLFFFASSEQQIIDSKDQIQNEWVMWLYEREIFKYLNSISLAITECGETFAPGVTTFYIAHTISLAENNFLNPKIYKSQFYRYMMNSDFIVISSKQDYDYIQNLSKEIFGSEDMSHKLLKFGNPSLEQSISSYGDFKKTKKKVVLLSFNIITYENPNSIIKLIDALLQKDMEVYFRPHPVLKEHSISIYIKNKYKNDRNFIFDSTVKFSNELKSKVTTIISDVSSMAHTFPLTTLKPAIIYIDDESNFYQNIDEIVRNPIQIHAKNPSECIELINKIYNNQDMFKSDISSFRSKNIYNDIDSQDSTSKKIANFIDEIIRLKH